MTCDASLWLNLSAKLVVIVMKVERVTPFWRKGVYGTMSSFLSSVSAVYTSTVSISTCSSGIPHSVMG